MSKRFTRETIAERIYKESNGTIELIGGFTRVRDKVKVRCLVCGHTWDVTPDSLHRGSGCPVCENKKVAQSLTLGDDELRRRIREATNNTVEPMEYMLGVSNKVLMRCTICGTTWREKPNRIYNGSGKCPTCNDIHHYTYEDRVRMVESVSNYTVRVLREFTKDGRKRMEVECLVCGHIWDSRVSHLKKGHLCPICGHKRASDALRMSTEDVKKRLYESTNGKIELVGEANGSNNLATLHCLTCGHIWDVEPQNIFQGRGCPKCWEEHRGESKTLSREEVERRIVYVSNGTLMLLGEYTRECDKTEVKCLKCGNIWNVTPNHIFNGRVCPRCNSSEGETKISYWFDEFWEEDDFVLQKRFDGLTGVGGGLLSYDFYIESKNLCIEYQGEQHYRPINFGTNVDAEEQFKVQQEHDQRKRQYCIDHGIDLLEIPYTEKDRIEEILNEKLLGTN